MDAGFRGNHAHQRWIGVRYSGSTRQVRLVVAAPRTVVCQARLAADGRSVLALIADATMDEDRGAILRLALTCAFRHAVKISYPLGAPALRLNRHVSLQG